MFLSSSLTVSMMALFPVSRLSETDISAPFMLLLSLVMSCTAYVFHNGMHSSHGLPFYKYTCLSEVIRRDRGITQVINEQKALPLTMIDDNIAIMLNREGWFVICDADKESDK